MTTNEDQTEAETDNLPQLPFTQAQVQVLYTRGLIDRATWTRVLLALRGSRHPESTHAVQTCEVAIEALVERAVDAACAVIQEKLGVKTGDLAAAVLSDGTIERELTRYVHAELTMAGEGEAEPAQDPDPTPAVSEAAVSEVAEPAPSEVAEPAPSDPGEPHESDQ